MNRRTALMLSMLGGLVPQSLWAQTGGRKSSKTRDKAFAPVSRDDERDDQAASGDEAPAPFPPEPGFQWKRYPIARYTARRQQPDQSPESDHRLDLQAHRASPSGMAIRSRCSLPRAPSSAPIIQPTCSSKSTRSSSASPTPSKTFSRSMSSSSPPSIPAGDTRCSTGSPSSATAPRVNRSGPCESTMRPSCFRRCRCSRDSASWPTSGSR